MRKNIKEYLRKVYKLETEHKKYFYAYEMLEESIEFLREYQILYIKGIFRTQFSRSVMSDSL